MSVFLLQSAYAMVDQKEFFAEMSVTFLSNGYRKLDKADMTMESCSPPLLQPSVSDRVLKRHGIFDDPYESSEKESMTCSFLALSSSLLSTNKKHPRPKLRIVDPHFQATAISRSCLDVVHCNKFYPFTRGQLKHHDPDLFSAMQGIWRTIATWDDPEEDTKPLCNLNSLLWLPHLFC